MRPHDLTAPQLTANLERMNLRRKEVAPTDPTHRAIKGWVDRAAVDAAYVYGTCALMDRLADGDTYFVVDRMGRLHHPITTVPKAHRRYVRIAGHGDLVAVDVGACQPALAGLVVRDDQMGPPDEVGHSVARWLDDCRAGVLYERLGDRVEADTGRRLDRPVVKQRLLAVMYGHPDHTETFVGLAMDGLYPGLRREFGRHNAVSRGAFARALQRRESAIMIGGAAAAFVRDYPDEVCVTIHDCLLVRAYMAGDAEGAVRRAWAAAGFDPAVKRERSAVG